ncbi:hypothetical protein SteCoe_26740 [Stentor coeruleus]|uniref:non-specific serine/threonine protein kinase n=1 Tax=Stentor coeruleus TaxID=5963 RepID=A0A1R2BC33_9CILI|nr:hypothetical protein SteCoe_26740 [Stentor coeruleus]
MGCAASLKPKKSNKNNHLIESNTPIPKKIITQLTASATLLDYSFIKALGTGAFSHVLLCIHTPTQQFRALKCIKKEALVPQQLNLIYKVQEAYLLRKIDHPNIIKCYEVFEDNDYAYLSLEYCPGGSLLKHFKEQKWFCEDYVCNIISQILSALAYIHEHKIMHRDIKANNVFIMDKDRVNVKIGDFGSACRLKRGQKGKGCFGTSYYIAPETLKGMYNEKVDIWSCGILLFILMTGEAPYIGQNTLEIKRQILQNPFTKEKWTLKIKEKLVFDLLESMLEINPEERFSAKQALMHPWITKYKKILRSKDQIYTNTFSDYYFNKIHQNASLYIAAYLVKIKEIEDFNKKFPKIHNINNKQHRLKKHFLPNIKNYSKNSNSFYYKQINLRNTFQTNTKTTQNFFLFKPFIEKNFTNKNFLSLSESILSSLSFEKYTYSECIISVFNMFDTDQDGFISLKDIQNTLGNLNIFDENIRKANKLYRINKFISRKKFVDLIQGYSGYRRENRVENIE